jgi:hypothetical protein
MPAKSNIAINVTLGELHLLLQLGELQDTEGAGTPTYKLQQETKLSREAIRSAFTRVQAALGEVVLERDTMGRIRATAAGRNAGRSSSLAEWIIGVAKSPATDQGKLEKYILAMQADMERRYASGEFNSEGDNGGRHTVLENGERAEAVGLSSGAERYAAVGEGPMTTEYRCEPDVTLGELLMLHELAVLAYVEQDPDPRSKLVERHDIPLDSVASSMRRVEQALGVVEDGGADGRPLKPTLRAWNIGEAAYLADFLVMLARHENVDQEKLRALIAEFFIEAESKMDSGQLAV